MQSVPLLSMKTEAIQSITNHISQRYDVAEYPALRRQIDDWQKWKPLQGMKLLDGTPLFTNTLVKFLPLLVGGAELTVAVSDAIPYDAALLPLKAIEQIYALYTYPTPGVDPETSWIGDKYTFADEKAVDITFATLRDPKRAVGNKTYLLGDENTVLGSTLMWNLGSGTGAEIVEAARDSRR